MTEFEKAVRDILSDRFHQHDSVEQTISFIVDAHEFHVREAEEKLLLEVEQLARKLDEVGTVGYIAGRFKVRAALQQPEGK